MWERPLRLIVRMPPRHGKSETCSHWTPVWFLDNWPDKRVMLASYEATFAAKWGRDVRDTILNNQDVLKVRIRNDVNATNNWETTAGGGMVTAGVGGPITGRGAHLAILDDPIKNAEEATSDVIRAKMRDWYKTTFRTRFEPRASCLVVYTAWVEDDIGFWLEKETGESWDVISFPALSEGNDILGRNEGEALWPERFDSRALEATRKSMTPYWFSAMYQQRPAQREGALFRRDTLRYCQMETVSGRTVYVLPAANKRFSKDLCRHFVMFDGARTEKKQADYTVASYFAVTPENDLLLLDVVRDHMPPDAFEALIRSQNEKHTPGFLGFEPADWNTAPVQSLVRQGFKCQRVPPEGTQQVDKILRSEATQIIQRNGKLYFLANAPWLPEVEAEHFAFPVGAHDDVEDTLSMAGNEVAMGRVTGVQPDVPYTGPRRVWGAM